VGSPQKATSVERRLEFLGARETQLHAALAEAVTGASRPRELDAGLRALLAERDQLEEQWLAAAEVNGLALSRSCCDTPGCGARFGDRGSGWLWGGA
jgi:hypothetical protein